MQLDFHPIDNVLIEKALRDIGENEPINENQDHLFFEEINYGGYEIIEHLAGIGLSFAASHGSGDNYGPTEFVCWHGELIYQQTNEAAMVIEVDRGQIDDQGRIPVPPHTLRFFRLSDLFIVYHDEYRKNTTPSLWVQEQHDQHVIRFMAYRMINMGEEDFDWVLEDYAKARADELYRQANAIAAADRILKPKEAII